MCVRNTLYPIYVYYIVITSFTASQHSGTIDEDKEDEEEGETRCTVCDKPFQDIEL